MRTITFGMAGFPGVTVTLSETEDGEILVEVAGDSPRIDLRALYFNADYDGDLVIQGEDVTGTSSGDTLSAGKGNNLRGATKDGFDMGVSLGTPGRGKDVITETSFTISSADGEPLTLDVLANQMLGLRATGGPDGQKYLMEMPAAPDAIDDSVEAVEDTVAVWDVLSNDTDADGDTLTIVSVDDPANGSATIVDNQIVYLADMNWSGTESFTYTISDGTGGFDTATITVDVEAVADAPLVSASTRAGSTVREVLVDVSSALTDTDGSESYVLKVTGIPAGVSVAGIDGDGMVTMPSGLDTLTLTLAEDMDFDFDLQIEAISTEASNGDTASSTASVNIALDHNESTQRVDFEAVDQSQWVNGNSFAIDDDRFIGVDESGSAGFSGSFYGNASYDVRVGLESDLHFDGGEVDAEIPWDVTMESSLNATTDMLEIQTGATLADGGYFLTQGPELTYDLDLIFDVAFGLNFGVTFLGVDYDLFNVNPGLDFEIGLIDFDSKTSPSYTIDFPYGISGTLAWPNLEVTGSEGASGSYSGSGASNNVVTLNLDVDDLAVQLAGLPVNPFDLSIDLVVAGGGIEILDIDLNAGLNFLQQFAMAAGTLDAELVLEDGTTQDFTFGDTLVFNDASTHDSNGDGDIDFDVVMDLTGSTLTNNTDLGFNVGWAFSLFTAYAWYNIGVDSGSTSVGPLVNLGGNYPIASIDLYDNTFALDFDGETISFLA